MQGKKIVTGLALLLTGSFSVSSFAYDDALCVAPQHYGNTEIFIPETYGSQEIEVEGIPLFDIENPIENGDILEGFHFFSIFHDYSVDEATGYEIEVSFSNGTYITRQLDTVVEQQDMSCLNLKSLFTESQLQQIKGVKLRLSKGGIPRVAVALTKPAELAGWQAIAFDDDLSPNPVRVMPLPQGVSDEVAFSSGKYTDFQQEVVLNCEQGRTLVVDESRITVGEQSMKVNIQGLCAAPKEIQVLTSAGRIWMFKRK